MQKKNIIAAFLAASLAFIPAADAVAQSRQHHSNDNGEQILNFGLGLGLGLLLNEFNKDNRRDHHRNHRDHRNYPRYDHRPHRGDSSYTQRMAQCFQAQAQLERAQQSVRRDGRITMTERHRLERLSYNVYQACKR